MRDSPTPIPLCCPVMNGGEPRSNPERLTVKQAAQRLNTSEAGVRRRIQRNTLLHEKDEETGRVYILLDGIEESVNNGDTGLDSGEPEDDPGTTRELIEALRDQLEAERETIRAERESNRELRRIIAGLTQRLPVIEAPESRESPVTLSEPRPDTQGPPEEERRPWWRRFFEV